MDEPPTTRHSLIVKLRDPADTAAWREFVAIYEPLVYRLARRKGLQDADARDLCQEVFRTVARAIESLGPGPRQLPRLALTDRPQPADQLPDATAVPAPRQRVHQRPGAPRSPAGRRPVGHGPVRGRVPPHLFRWAADEVEGEFAPTTWQAFWQTAVEGRSAGTTSRPSWVCPSGPSTSPAAGSWPA